MVAVRLHSRIAFKLPGVQRSMNTYLLTWNPNHWYWDLEADRSIFLSQGYLNGRWSCGRRKSAQIGDRFFLLRQGREPRGIMAAGSIESVPYYDEHWDETRDDEALYVDIVFESLLHPEYDGILPRSALSAPEFAGVHWDTQSSGILIPPRVAEKLERHWNMFLEKLGQSPIVLADEIITPEAYYEGASVRVSVNRYERDANARKACIAHHGAGCIACGFDFGKVYGERGAGFIHVHHLVPLSKIKKGYQVDPAKDLVPLCPNCHAMVHRYPGTLTIDQLRDLLS